MRMNRVPFRYSMTSIAQANEIVCGVSCQEVFIFAGYQPNTQSLQGIVKLNDRQEIMVDADMKTGIPGVFAAGDCIAKKYRQVTTAVADGTIAALSAGEYLHNDM